jgi:hypothetical protein
LSIDESAGGGNYTFEIVEDGNQNAGSHKASEKIVIVYLVHDPDITHVPKFG